MTCVRRLGDLRTLLEPSPALARCRMLARSAGNRWCSGAVSETSDGQRAEQDLVGKVPSVWLRALLSILVRADRSPGVGPAARRAPAASSARRHRTSCDAGGE